MSNLTLGSLFSGSGGFELAGCIAGIKPVWNAEVEPFCIAVTRKNFPDVKHYGDVSAMDGGKIEPVDIITFGSPCQDMSIAGKRSGLDGERSSLFYEAVRIVKEMRCATGGKYPRYIVWENVPGAFSSNGGEDFRCVLEEICKIKDERISVPESEKWTNAGEILGDGFSVAWRVLDAQYWGVPQRRKRIFLVADFGDEGAGKILFDSESLPGHLETCFSAWQRAAGNSPACFGIPSLCLNDQGGQRMDVSEDVTSTLRAEAHHPPCVMALENHPTDGRIKIEESGKFQTLSGRMGTGGNNTPMVLEPVTMKIRCGCEGGGKGVLLQEDKSATLSCNNDQTLFVPEQESCYWDGSQTAGTLTQNNAGGTQRMPDKDNFNCVLESGKPKAYGISSFQSNAMLSDNPHSGIYEAEIARTLDTGGGNPDCNQGGVCIVEQEKCYDIRQTSDGTKVSRHHCYETETSRSLSTSFPDPAGNHGGVAIVEKAYSIQGNLIGRDDKNGPQGDGINEDVSFTLNATDHHAVYASSKASFFTRANEETADLLVATDYKDPQAVIYTDTEPKYTVRRLTPVECARLQGFPDWWCYNLGAENPTDEELAFWTDIWETHRKAVSHSSKPKTEKQIRKWLSEPYSDASAYKMWGNGIALPCAVFVLSSIVYYSQLQTG